MNLLRRLLCVLFCGVIFSSLYAQNTVTGKVTSADGKPLEGASVRLKGTSAGATTDGDGTYRITVPGGRGTLIISSVGY